RLHIAHSAPDPWPHGGPARRQDRSVARRLRSARGIGALPRGAERPYAAGAASVSRYRYGRGHDRDLVAGRGPRSARPPRRSDGLVRDVPERVIRPRPAGWQRGYGDRKFYRLVRDTDRGDRGGAVARYDAATGAASSAPR